MISTAPAGEGDSTSFNLLRVMTAASDIDGLPGQGKIQEESRPFAGTAFYANLSGVLLDDAVGNRKTQTRAAALAFPGSRFGGEKGIVDAGNVFGGNTAARIGHGHGHATPVAGDHAQGSAARHRVLGVQEQVQK